MQRRDHGLLFSASDLVTFLGCRHATWLDLRALDDPALQGAPTDEQLELLQAKGDEHETAYLASLRAGGADIWEVPTRAALRARVAATRDAMSSGVAIVYQGVLHAPPWLGYADFLRRVPGDSALGGWCYEPVDTKLARAATVKHLVQLGVYAELLSRAQEVRPREMHLVLGDNREATFRVAESDAYLAQARGRLERFCAAAPAGSRPEPCAHCDICHWRPRCDARWQAEDHLSRVAGVRREQARKLEAAGVDTIAALASLEDDASIPRLAPTTLARLRAQARLQVAARAHGQDRIELLPEEPGRGFMRVPRVDVGDLFFDIEGDPLYDDQLEYLFGLHWMEDGEPRHLRIWAHDHDQERRALEQLMDFFRRHLGAHPRAHIYHYNHYEITALERLASRYATREDVLDDLLRKRRFVDLYTVVREAMRTSRPGLSLKEMEKLYLEEARSGAVTTAGDSIVKYERWRRSGDRALLDEIAHYNEVDCVSTRALRDWLLGHRPEETPWFEPSSDEDEHQAAARSERQAEAQARRETMGRRLLDGAPVPERRVRELLMHLLEFHRREKKPRWWAMFERMERAPEELVDDVECLGGLRQCADQPPVQVKRSTVYTYAFPAQEFKLAPGKACHRTDTGERAGVIEEVDADRLRVRIRRARRSGPLPTALSVGPPPPIDDDVLREAVWRFADSVAARDGRYPALRAFLDRTPPRLAQRATGTPLVRPGANTVRGTCAAVADLEASHLFVQGPPGAGKTFTASHAIVSVLAAGKKVGISSNTHKAIDNLLAAVEARAAERRVPFAALKKASHGQDDPFAESDAIRTVYNNDEVDPDAVSVVAGTAWLFARPELDQRLDYLFVDEAGQVSLANLIAMGLAARNLVLVGDQMQLAQPIQGIHPGESGLSALDYLLEGHSTVAPDRGVFLATSWRMHPTVCGFLSEMVYDGRLAAHPDNERQVLRLAEDAHPALLPAGIRLVPVEHEGCGQRSDEEAQTIREIWESLVEQRYVDRKGEERPMAAENILVVAPYNAQVNRLQQVLPPEARTGTVDRFQGQEAEAVIVSMTTSGDEDLPRGIEFLLSRNRLNVAISRARSLALVVASPRLA